MINATRFSILALIGTLLLTALGCAHLTHKEQTKKLDQAVKNYIHAVRWGDYGAAASFIRPRKGKFEMPEINKLKVIKVTHYEYSVDSRAKGDPEALMTAAFEYYDLNTSKVSKVYQQAIWWWDPEAKNWFMDGELPEFVVN